MLEQQLQLKHTQLRNRLVMGSMHTGLEEGWHNRKRLSAFYEARAKGGTAMIITGGYSPNLRGKLTPISSSFNSYYDVFKHRAYTGAVHKHGGKICLQLLHAGRYAYHPFNQAPSAIQAPINPYKPKQMSLGSIKKNIKDFAHSAYMAEKAGYDGVEVMGSEGYLINEFMAPHTNKRDDEFGGSLENRMRLALEIVKAVRAKVSDTFLIIFRLSVMDLIPNGSTPDEVTIQAKALEQAGVDIFNTGIGWHEARVPTIASMVPPGAFKEASKRLKSVVNVPVIAVNRINTPDIANQILNDNEADLISMARPLLADPEFFNKYQNQQTKQINICIGCNQGCLDHVFKNKRATCLVNPQAAFELDYPLDKASNAKNVLVVGAGPAGLAASCYLAEKGHTVTLIDQKTQMGGQFNLAMQIPGKEDFNHTLSYFTNELERLNVNVELGKAYDDAMLQKYDDIVFATGVRPREAAIECADSKRVFAYDEVIRGEVELGKSIAILGAGGIGFDMVAFLSEHKSQSIPEFKKQWGIECEAEPHKDERQLYMLKRSAGRFGSGLGKTTGWIHRQVAKQHGVKQIADCQYHSFDKNGLTVTVAGEKQVLPVDTVIACIGQVSNNEVLEQHRENAKVHVIGGAKLAAAIDAKRAIFEALQVARAI
ncbi:MULTISPECIES: NADPH-dependent 2,4-dienoyl-CoA reductase [Pseudoalteromonas]|uniref:oxidoreductase n=1 Tax=Pseudoalteromonas TaxID=53246 RepID=UPI0002CC7D20|nr:MULTISPECIES: NADPH-dependent 2,4-dienoyl-CoA reductase [Pseudoalteromonas]MCP4057431.1 FAD-dependent oxidoreductase [Pseudoalteromonas sp.]ENN98814.1 2,4-dienoyl-CoA reductase [Pseudoalteromonas agarivorans S816]MDI3243863.1 FAD-dependent oxidoreductase [Pseudoalteromonas agarivorans]TMS70362.1 NADPH-dependent 2,4-dienoyl-CoA reductase [Pseudoalteromonas sp. S1691]TMS72004.1 NADPH-dependent 2,4-dienoyl-CoA reductase [Pseudoalteromonas sp. S1731]|tara:strand:+ start:996 stop:2957 length:1962 start_codon:yes stop_codon:yes gene_type:complete